MDPNEQEADEKLIQAEEIEDSAEILRAQGNTEDAAKLEEEAQDLKEGNEQKKMDAESLVNQGLAQERNHTQPQ
jgi:hypothetical protein